MRTGAVARALALTLVPLPGQPAPAPPAAAAAAGLKVVVNGHPLAPPVPPRLDGGTTMVPLRAIFAALGAEVAWDGETRTVTATRGARTVTLRIGETTARVGRVPYSLRVAAAIAGGHTLVPLRFVSEALGAEVGWDGTTRTVTITGAAALPAPPAGAERVTVARVLSGGAFTTGGGEAVRLAHVRIAAGQSGAAEQFTRAVLAGQDAYLTDGADRHDAHNRLLADVWLPDGQLLQEALVREGLATPAAGSGAEPLAARLAAAQQEARSAGRGAWAQPAAPAERFVEADGIRMAAAVQGGRLAAYDGSGWRPRFWRGVNVGATVPGTFPGELAAGKADYLRWFPQIKAMNADLIRIYTLLPPAFYAALQEFNATQAEPLWLVQGVWAPEEELLGPGAGGADAFAPEITGRFEASIRNAVRAVHGDLTLAPRPGHASGTYTADVSRYLLGYIVGIEWHPPAVKATNAAHPDMAPYTGTYFTAGAAASSFESWLAGMGDVLATEAMRYGWQHPVAFANWVTTDPLHHPDEPNRNEDLVAVDPMHVRPTSLWPAGYFASYHVYPYYPDFLRYDPDLLAYPAAGGRPDPYAGYLQRLRAHHAGVPLLVTEFGVPSSRGLAHRGALGRDQGMHTEAEQGEINAGMLAQIHAEGLDGAILFQWQDEWFKSTWNTWDLERPYDRKALWWNPLTNEQHFGVLAVAPGTTPAGGIYLDGSSADWRRPDRKAETRSYPGFDLSLSHDEAYLYLLLEKRSGDWNFAREELHLGFDTLPGGSRQADRAPGLAFAAAWSFCCRSTGRAPPLREQRLRPAHLALRVAVQANPLGQPLRGRRRRHLPALAHCPEPGPAAAEKPAADPVRGRGTGRPPPRPDRPRRPGPGQPGGLVRRRRHPGNAHPLGPARVHGPQQPQGVEQPLHGGPGDPRAQSGRGGGAGAGGGRRRGGGRGAPHVPLGALAPAHVPRAAQGQLLDHAGRLRPVQRAGGAQAVDLQLWTQDFMPGRPPSTACCSSAMLPCRSRGAGRRRFPARVNGANCTQGLEPRAAKWSGRQLTQTGSDTSAEVMGVEVDLRGAELALLDALAEVNGQSREAALAQALNTLALERLCHYGNQVGGHLDEDSTELEAAAKGRMRRIVRALNAGPGGSRYRVRGPYLQIHHPELRQWRRVFDFRAL